VERGAAKRIGVALGLLLLGGSFGLVLSEGIIRLLRPELRDLVDTKFQRHAYRIHANPRAAAYTRIHPDTQEEYVTIHNSLGFRQHREFQLEKPRGLLRIGFFGDSFTENMRMWAPYSFTEPLDHLLNEAGIATEVLNFGTDGYGTDQVLLQYLDEAPLLELDVVFYLYCHNDLKDILADRLFEVSETGELRYLPQHTPSWWKELLRRFYLTYFVAGAISQYSPSVKERLTGLAYDPETVVDAEQERANRKRVGDVSVLKRTDALEESLRLFRRLVSELRDATRRRNQRFAVVLLPISGDANLEIARILRELEIEVLDLFPRFQAEAQPRDAFFFENDAHWNEEGNKVAAVHLFEYLTGHLGLPGPGDEFVGEALHRYYSAFAPAPVSGSWLKPSVLEEDERQRVRGRYLELDRARDVVRAGR
jgi:hypothetical protein